MISMRLLCLTALIGLATPLSAPAAAAGPLPLYVQNLRVVVDRAGFASVHGLVVCNFPHDAAHPDLEETGGLLRQHKANSISLGDFTQCGTDIDLSPFPGADDGTRYRPGAARLEDVNVHLCHDDTQTAPCFDWSFNGPVTIRRTPIVAAPTLQVLRVRKQATAAGVRVSTTLRWQTHFHGGYPSMVCVQDLSGTGHDGCVTGIPPLAHEYTTSPALIGAVPPRTLLRFVVTVFPPMSPAQETNGVRVRV